MVLSIKMCGVYIIKYVECVWVFNEQMSCSAKIVIFILFYIYHFRTKNWWCSSFRFNNWWRTDEELKELIPFLKDRKKFKMALHKDGAKILPSALPSENIMVYINF